jgi:ABC-type Mn2+/Zn2+ transport system ATPase subunit
MCGPGERPPRLAYVLQSQQASEHLLVTAREVVALARSSQRGLFGRLDRADRTAIDSALDRLDVSHLANRHLAEMSGGQRQRVFIAQGLAQEAEVLLLDEPVAGLDLASMHTIRGVIDEECAAGRTVVVATHDLEEARRADCVVMLAGRVVAAGAPADVLRAENLREAYQGRVIELGGGLMTVDDAHHHDH